LPERPAASRAARRNGKRLHSPCSASRIPAASRVRRTDRRKLRTNPPALPRPRHNSEERRSHVPPSPARSFDRARSAGPSVRRSCSRAVLGESAPRSDAPCASACVAPCGRLPELHPRTPPPPASSSAVVPFSSAASAARFRSPHAPYAGAPPTSWQLRQSFLRRTRTLYGSLQTTPLWLSSPNSLLRFGLRPNQSTRSLPGWAKTKCRTGPDQNTEIKPREGQSQCIRNYPKRYISVLNYLLRSSYGLLIPEDC